MKKTQKTIVLASGGTGGHMFPACVLADELISRKYKVVLVTDERGSKLTKNFDSNVDVYVIKAKTFKKGLFSKIGALFNIGCGFLYALKILIKIKPSALVSFGGYASFPSTLAASTIKVPVVLHEQNALLGRTNRFMLPFANKLATSFKNVSKLTKAYKKKKVFVGNPVSQKIVKLHKNKYPEGKELNIMITGGSQGAIIFGEVVPEAIALLSKKERSQITITQQVVEKDMDSVKEFYANIGVKAEISSFFNDMDKRLKNANLFIGRAGALTVNEFLIVGRPAILVPLPIAMEDHQTINAGVLADGGAGWIMQQDIFTAENLVERLKYFIKNPEVLKSAGKNAKNMAILDAGEKLADLVEGEIRK